MGPLSLCAQALLQPHAPPPPPPRRRRQCVTHSVIPKTVKFGGCPAPQMMWELYHRGRGGWRIPKCHRSVVRRLLGQFAAGAVSLFGATAHPLRSRLSPAAGGYWGHSGGGLVLPLWVAAGASLRSNSNVRMELRPCLLPTACAHTGGTP